VRLGAAAAVIAAFGGLVRPICLLSAVRAGELDPAVVEEEDSCLARVSPTDTYTPDTARGSITPAASSTGTLMSPSREDPICADRCHDRRMPLKTPDTLLSEIERDLLDNLPIADVLRKLIILGGRAGSSDLRDWASQELRGYADADIADLPNYRRIPGTLQLDGISGNTQIRHQTIGAFNLPKEVQERISNQVAFPQGIGELQSLVREADESRGIQISLPAERMIARLMEKQVGDPYQHISALYWMVSRSSVEGLIDQVRTRLAELLGELRAVTPARADGPTADQASNAVNVVINGKGNRVHVAQAQGGEPASANSGEVVEGRFWTFGRRIWAAVVGLATVAGAVIAWWQTQGPSA
jgi:hypothetical protein